MLSDGVNANENSGDTSFPEQAVTKLKSSLSTLGDKAKGALKGISKIKEKWTTYSVADRAVLVQTLKGSTGDFQAMLNLKEDPIGGMQGALSVIANFATLTGPKGQLVSESIAFVSGLFSLLGGEEKSVGEIVREQIDEALGEFYQKDLSNEAAGVASTFDISASYVRHLAQEGEHLTVDQIASLERHAPLYLSLTFMGKLAAEIESIVKKNPGGDEAKKCLAYIELYTKMAVLKDTILTQTASLYPDELKPNKEALLVAMANLRTDQKAVFKFLFEGDVSNNIIPYYDPDIYPVTDAYLTNVLKVPNYNRDWAGVWCLTPSIKGKEKLAMSFSTVPSYLQTDTVNPYITLMKAKYCNWKLIPHGKSLFTVRNIFDCKDDKKPTCGRYLSFAQLTWPQKFKSRLDLKKTPMLWEIVGNGQKRIRCKYGCGAKGGDGEWCNFQIGLQTEFDIRTLCLTSSNTGYIWYMTKEPMIKV